MRTDPDFRIVFIFHMDLSLFARTFERCIHALTEPTRQSYEVTIYCDGTPEHVFTEVAKRAIGWGVDTLVLRQRSRHVAVGAPGNNAHRRLFDAPNPYLIVIEDDVSMYKHDKAFDVLTAIRESFDATPTAVALTKIDDHEKWSWALTDVTAPRPNGDRIVNRLATHFVCYMVPSFMRASASFGIRNLDLFVDRNDWSYNWEDLVSHVGTTGGNVILFPQAWPLRVFHCDDKVAAGSMFNTQDVLVKTSVLDALDSRFSGTYRMDAPGDEHHK